ALRDSDARVDAQNSGVGSMPADSPVFDKSGPFGPLAPGISSIRAQRISGRSKMCMSLLVDSMLCGAILRGEACKDNARAFADAPTQSVRRDLHMSVATACHDTCTCELLTPVRQVTFLAHIGNGQVQTDYADKCA
ncbi:unnamed protein product, partial [Prorocentrum cordatum]